MNTRLVEVWEVYERDSDRSIAYLNYDDARNTDFWKEIDLIAKAVINVNEEEYNILLSGKGLF